MVRATSRRRDFGSFRISRRKDSARSICKIGLEIAAVFLDLSSLSLALDSPISAFHKAIQFLFGHAIFSKSIVISVNGDWPESDNRVAMENANVFAFCRPFQKRGKIDSGLRRRKRSHASILRRYSEQARARRPIRNARRLGHGSFART